MGISIAMVACNEAATLRRVLQSVAWADEIVLVDSGSTDDTIAIALEFNAHVYSEPWKGYGGQVNSAIDKCSCEWIFSLDADEVVSPELAKEIRIICQPPASPQVSNDAHSLPKHDSEIRAYTVPRLNQIFGRWMRHGGLYPDRKLRLFQRGTARLPEDTEPHATPKWKGGPVGKLKSNLLHYAYPSIGLYFEHMDRYSTASVPLLLRRGKTSRTLPAFIKNVVLNPFATFVYNYFLRSGFLDGKEGLMFHMYHATYIKQKYVKAWRAAKNQS
jgi:glycosyltransferase involved in cell wall biosynthesis